MARICTSCNKFASIDESADVDIENEEVDGSTLTVEVRVPLVSACCSEEMAEQTLTWEVDLDEEHINCTAEEPKEGEELEEDEEGRYEIVGSVDAEFTSDSDKPKLTTVTRGPNKGKTRYTPSRYLRTYYGAHLRVTVRCNRCEEEFEVEGDALEPASSFDSY